MNGYLRSGDLLHEPLPSTTVSGTYDCSTSVPFQYYLCTGIALSLQQHAGARFSRREPRLVDPDQVVDDAYRIDEEGSEVLGLEPIGYAPRTAA